MKKVKLPAVFRPLACPSLMRLGRDYDGGYLVNRPDILQAEVLVGLGINDDWSFEQEFSDLNSCDVYAYDASVSEKKFRKKFLRSIHKFFNIKLFRRSLKTYTSYRSYFKDNRHHIEKFVGVDFPPNNVDFNDVLTRVDGRKVFYKIDIEGSEYRILNQLIDNASSITGIVCEFHDCDLHIDTIAQFVSDLDLTLVHVHANNNSPVAKGEIPLALELTFTSSEISAEKILQLPHKLDMPNTRRNDEIEIGFY